MENNNCIFSKKNLCYTPKTVYTCFQTIMDKSVGKVASFLQIPPLFIVGFFRGLFLPEELQH